MTSTKGWHGFHVTAEIKDRFFDRQKIIDAVDKENHKRLSKAGAFLRKRARSSLRRSKKSARPGSPPRVHSRDSFATLKNILFALHGDKESVIVGPRAVPSAKLHEASAKYVPELLEFGGTSVVRGVRCRYSAFPFMGPALEEEVRAGTISDLFINRG